MRKDTINKLLYGEYLTIERVDAVNAREGALRGSTTAS